MYRINDQTLLTNGFVRRGVVEIVAPHRFVVTPVEVHGLVIYIMRVGSEYMKGGHTGKKSSSFVARMKSEFGCLVPVIAAGPPYLGDPWKRFVPLTLAVPGVIEFWVRPYTDPEQMLEDEQELNDFYRGLWTREGQPRWTAKKRQRKTLSTLRLEREPTAG